MAESTHMVKEALHKEKSVAERPPRWEKGPQYSNKKIPAGGGGGLAPTLPPLRTPMYRTKNNPVRSSTSDQYCNGTREWHHKVNTRPL